MADKKKKNQASLGCLFWIAFILLIIILFFFNKNIINSNISNVLEKTGASTLFPSNKKTAEQSTGDKTSDEQQPVPATETNLVPDTTRITGDGSKEPEPSAPNADTAETPTPPASTGKDTATVPKKPAQGTTHAAQTTANPNKTAPAQKPAVPIKQTATKPATKHETDKQVTTRKATLYFVTIDADGSVLRKEVFREIPQNDSPLSETLQILFKGTTQPESVKGYRSLIPQGTKLLSATVKNGVATINLSENFQFNQFGIEGYLGQLAQIVFTATAFPTVTSVQFLIEGQRREYLGAEGVWIGTPLSRDKFQ